MGQLLQGMDVAEGYQFWFSSENGMALLSAQHLAELESLPFEWRVPPHDVFADKELSVKRQVENIVAVIGSDEWSEVAALRDRGLIDPLEFYRCLCDAITRPYRLVTRVPKYSLVALARS
jgi:hypothetical protein